MGNLSRDKLPRKEYAFRLAMMASSKAPPNEVYNYITKHSTDQWHDEMTADEVKCAFKRRIEEDGLHLTRAGRIVKIKGGLSYTPSASDACADPLIDGHIHPAQSAVPSYGDLDPDHSDMRGVPEMWIARPTARKGSRIICIRSKANGFTREELQDLSDLREDLDNGFEFDEPDVKIALDMGSTIPINLDPDITLYENFFVRNARQAGFNVKKIDFPELAKRHGCRERIPR